MEPVTDESDRRNNSLKRKNSDNDNSDQPPKKEIRTTDGETDLSPISILSDDALVKIISFIPMAQWASLEKVSHAFRRATFGNWSRLRDVKFDEDFVLKKSSKTPEENSTIGKKLTPQERFISMLEKLVLRAPNITSISGFSAFFGRGIKSIFGVPIRLLAQFKKLESLCFAEIQIYYCGLAKFLETSENRGRLKCLDLANAVRQSRTAANQQSDSAALEKVFNADNPDMVPLRLEKFHCELKKLDWEIFNVMDVSQLTTLCLVGALVPPSVLIKLIGRCTQLERLEFDLTRCLDMETRPKESEHLNENKELLQAVAASPSENLSILKMGVSLYRRSRFCVETCFSVGTKAVVDMINALSRRLRPLLEFALLDESLCNGQVIAAIADKMGNLSALELHPASCDSATLIKLFVNLRRLEKVALFSETKLVNDDVVSAMVASSKDLKQFSLTKRSRYYDEVPDSFSNLFQLDLNELFIDHYKFQPTTLTAWSEGFCSGLKTLRFGECSNINDDAFVPFVKKLPSLRRLELEDADITDEALRSIASSCPNLRDVSLQRCDEITTEGVQAIIDGCSLLKTIRCYGRQLDWAWKDIVKVGKYRKVILK